MKTTNRRGFILGSSAVSAATFLGNQHKIGAVGRRRTEVHEIQDPRFKELITTAVNVATEAGASYADARLTHIEKLSAGGPSPIRNEHMAFGVRALVNGFWGFAASPVWSIDEAMRLGRAAVNQAKSHGFNEAREIHLAPMQEIESGHWTMPIKDDPFEMSYEEISDFIGGLSAYISTLPKRRSAFITGVFFRNQKAFGSSLGQYTSQKLYRSEGSISIVVGNSPSDTYGGEVETLSPAGMGFELFRDQPIRDNILKVYEEAVYNLSLPQMPIDVGRYETLINNKAIADLVSRTIGKPTEIDTAFGHEANAGGTGFIDPLEMLGSYKIGHSSLNITGDRSRPGSVGVVRWDDEGIKPVKFDIVKSGIVTGMQSHREGSQWIKDYLVRTGQPIQSIGCAYAPSAMDVPMVHTVDLTIAPSSTNNTLDSLRQGIKRGIEIKSPMIDVDFQCITGFARNNIFEVRNGKRVGRYPDASMLFRTPELWNGLMEIGGPDTMDRYGIETKKGEPVQASVSSVYSVPAVFKEMTFVGIR